MADLQLSGHYAQRFECRPFDVVSYVGPTPVRVQVKGVDDKPGARSCSWCITNGPTGPNAKRKRYGPDDFDVLACVTTNSRLIGYVPASDVDFTKSTFSLPVQSMDGRYIAGYSLQRILERLGLVR
jgi:Na+-transporting NADH:ubiquinone oxidoreductase subunit NqrA